ncbi:hypothetical protein COGO111638_07975 [Corynebacterium gottingense]
MDDRVQQAFGAIEPGSSDDIRDEVARLLRRVLQRPDTQVRGRGAHHNARGYLALLAYDFLSGADHCERACGFYADGVHEFADEVLTEHGADRAESVGAWARKWGESGAFELYLASVDVAEEHRATVAKHWHELAELMARVRGGVSARGACEPRDALWAAQPLGIEAELARVRLIEDDEFRVRKVGPWDGHCHVRQRVGERVGKRGLFHGPSLD